MRHPYPSTLVAASLLSLSLSALADRLDVPIMEYGGDGQMANCTGSVVSGLDPRGDGFLAVRTGRGTKYRKIGELHNGDTVTVFDQKGGWAGVVWDESSITCSSRKTRPVPYKNKGWVHGKWLKHVAG